MTGRRGRPRALIWAEAAEEAVRQFEAAIRTKPGGIPSANAEALAEVLMDAANEIEEARLQAVAAFEGEPSERFQEVGPGV